MNRGKVEKQPCSHQGQRKRRERRCSRHQSRDSLAAHEEDHGEAAHGSLWWGRHLLCSPWRTPCQCTQYTISSYSALPVIRAFKTQVNLLYTTWHFETQHFCLFIFNDQYYLEHFLGAVTLTFTGTKAPRTFYGVNIVRKCL